MIRKLTEQEVNSIPDIDKIIEEQIDKFTGNRAFDFFQEKTSMLITIFALYSKYKKEHENIRLTMGDLYKFIKIRKLKEIYFEMDSVSKKYQTDSFIIKSIITNYLTMECFWEYPFSEASLGKEQKNSHGYGASGLFNIIFGDHHKIKKNKRRSEVSLAIKKYVEKHIHTSVPVIFILNSREDIEDVYKTLPAESKEMFDFIGNVPFEEYELKLAQARAYQVKIFLCLVKEQFEKLSPRSKANSLVFSFSNDESFEIFKNNIA